MTDPMLESLATYVNQAHGPTNTGEGQQLNNFYFQAASRVGRPTRDRLAVAEDEREWLDRCFTEPERYGQARDMLRDHGTVLLYGQPGSGRRAAALMLLHRSPGGTGSLHELPDTSDDEDSRALDASVVGEGDRLLLDLANSDETHYLAVQSELSAFRDVVRQKDARLVVVLPYGLRYLQQGGLGRFTVEILRPRGRDVLMRYLRLDGITPSPDELSAVPELPEYLLRAHLRDIAELARSIREQRDGCSDRPDGFSQWCSRALAVVSDRTPEVAAFISALDGRHRALSLSLAMLHERTPATVFHATEELLKAINHPPDEQPRLERTDLTEQLKVIKAETRSDGRVRFLAPGYDKAIRAHFWTYCPDLRDAFQKWIGGCVQRGALTDDERAELIPRFAEQCLRTDRPEDMLELAEQWTQHNGDQGRLMPDAAQLLAEGLRDERHGRAFRKAIYNWSKDTYLPAVRRRALVVVCFQTMATTHPDQALVRLHHLARRERPAKENPALDALLALAAGDGRLLRLLLDRLEPGKWPRDAVAFYALADHASRTRALYCTAAVRERLATGWAAVFLYRSHEEWSEPARGWLAAAGALPEGRGGQLLDVLAGAAASRPGTPGRLHVLFRNWAYTNPERAALVSRFDCALDAAQGIEPLPLGT
ncbi:ABC transporter substrate-binding protein [Streptomyces sp. NPDC057654]|uniref:ABC transporter substrate-binding protein n=1 Tax=Streptomyces sp. NPDC057654 TaxID=3346196 RepID=UPI003683D33A